MAARRREAAQRLSRTRLTAAAKSASQDLRGRLLSARQDLPLLLILLAVTFAYMPSLGDYFHGDDFIAFVDLATKPFFRHMADVITLSDSDFYWRPLGQIYYRILYAVGGLDPVYYHVANLAVFLATLCLLYRFCLRAGFRRPVALGAAALFGLLPNHAISVAWVTNAPREIGVMFFMASLVLLQRALESRRFRDEALAFAAFVLAGLSDETILGLAPVPVLYAALVRGWGSGDLLREMMDAIARDCVERGARFIGQPAPK